MNTNSISTKNAFSGPKFDPANTARCTACVAVIWVSGSASEHELRQALLDKVEAQDGVTSARFSATKPLFMMADYLPGQIRASTIVNAVNGPGVRARLVGC